MASSPFRLDRVLRFRAYHERLALAALSNARNEYMRIRNSIELLVIKKTEMMRRYQERESTGISVAQYRAYTAFLEKLKFDLEHARQELDLADKKVKVLEKDWRIKALKKKTLEILKELHFTRQREEAERRAQKVLDELAVMGKGR